MAGEKGGGGNVRWTYLALETCLQMENSRTYKNVERIGDLEHGKNWEY